MLEAGIADAQCVNGLLLVKEIHSSHYGARPMGRDNYHVYDYSLFHMNLRKNAETRVAQYLAQHPPATEVPPATSATGAGELSSQQGPAAPG